MQDLRVIGTESGALLVADDDGTRYRLPVDDVLQVKLRQVTPEPGIGQRLAPREIQAYIRSGMSAEDVATVTGAPLEHIQRFEGPVLAERDFIVTSARAVPVHTALETDPLAQGATFGSAISARLHDLGAASERWASWKDAETGWIVKLSFTANQIDHDARWHFDPKRSALDPLNSEAITLSQQGEAAGALLPRLRAVHSGDRHQDSTRFDSGAFDLADAPDASARVPDITRGSSGISPTASEPIPLNQTADLLDALRRRRGEREAASYEDEFPEIPQLGPAGPPITDSIHIIEIPIETAESSSDQSSTRKTAPQPSMRNSGSQPRMRKGRTAMPSWDEIVFGARPDDDLA